MTNNCHFCASIHSTCFHKEPDSGVQPQRQTDYFMWQEFFIIHSDSALKCAAPTQVVPGELQNWRHFRSLYSKSHLLKARSIDYLEQFLLGPGVSITVNSNLFGFLKKFLSSFLLEKLKRQCTKSINYEASFASL